MEKHIPNFNNYMITSSGQVFNSEGYFIKQRVFKNTRFVRLYKNGKRHTVSVNKLLFNEFKLVDKHLSLGDDEEGIRYENSHYFLTNKGRCYNSKTCSFLKPIYRNDYPTFNLYLGKGKRKTVYPLRYLNKYFLKEAI